MNNAFLKNTVYIFIILGAVLFYFIFIFKASSLINGVRYFNLFDDAMISMRYAKNFAEGNGLVWNPGEQVEGYTNFFWVMIMSLFHFIPVDQSKISLAVSLTGAVILILNILVVKSVSKKISNNSFFVTSSAMFFTAFYFGLIFWTLRGMETGLLTLLVNYSLLLIFRLQENISGHHLLMLAVSLVLILLTRSDTIILALYLAATCALTITDSKVKTASILLLVISGTLISQTAFRLVYYDDFLPNTYYLKLGGIPLSDRLYRGTDTFLSIFSARILPFVLPVIIYFFNSNKDPERKNFFILSGLFLLTCLYSLFVGGDSWEWMPYTNRFITVGMPALIILFCCSVRFLFLKYRRQKVFLISSLIIIIYLLVLCLFTDRKPEYEFIEGKNWIGQNLFFALAALYLMTFIVIIFLQIKNAGSNKTLRFLRLANLFSFLLIVMLIVNGYSFFSWREKNAVFTEQDNYNSYLGCMLKNKTDFDVRVADSWAGNSAYFSGRYSIDLLGKMDKHIAKQNPNHGFFLPGHSKWDYAYSIKTYKPDLIMNINPDYITPEIKQILDSNYELTSKGFYILKGSSKFDRNFF